MKTKLLAFAVILLFGIFSTSVLAVDGIPGGTRGAEPSFSPFPTGAPRETENPESSFSPFPSGSPRGRFSLEGGRLQSCQARENSVKARLTSLTRLVVMMEGKFDAIAARVEAYYTNTLVPGGHTLSNYSTLTGDIAAKKTAVDTALAKAQTDSTSFSCTGDDPKGLLNTFRLDMQAVKRALEAYRTSIKNLIVAVRTLVPEPSGSPEAKESPKASESPEPTETPAPSATPI